MNHVVFFFSFFDDDRFSLLTLPVAIYLVVRVD